MLIKNKKLEFHLFVFNENISFGDYKVVLEKAFV